MNTDLLAAKERIAHREFSLSACPLTSHLPPRTSPCGLPTNNANPANEARGKLNGFSLEKPIATRAARCFNAHRPPSLIEK
jgi:hypothetical protein